MFINDLLPNMRQSMVNLLKRTLLENVHGFPASRGDTNGFQMNENEKKTTFSNQPLDPARRLKHVPLSDHSILSFINPKPNQAKLILSVEEIIFTLSQKRCNKTHSILSADIYIPVNI